jgi:hypothetical protein
LGDWLEGEKATWKASLKERRQATWGAGLKEKNTALGRATWEAMSSRRKGLLLESLT